MNKPDRTTIDECPRGSFPAPLDLLRRLANSRLPIHIVDDTEIEILRILKLGGSIKAAIPDAARLPGGLDQARRKMPATVDEITRLGRSMLDLFARGGALTRSHVQYP